MASPQRENGWTGIAHEIIEALARWPGGGRMLRILLLILRESYGRNRKEALLSLRDISKRTGISKPHCSYLLRELGLLRMVTGVRVTTNGNHHKTAWIFQKDFDVWGVPSTVTVTKNGNGSVAKNGNGSRTRAKKEREKITPPVPYLELLKTYNDNRGDLPEAREISGERKRKVNAAFEEKPDLSYWRDVVCKLAKSPGAAGQNDRGWRADIDFVLRSHVRIMEGKYDQWGVGTGQTLPLDPYAHLRAKAEAIA